MINNRFWCVLTFPSISVSFVREFRLRQDSQLLQSRAINWSQDFQTQNLNGSTNSISSSTGNINNECNSESNSSTETLKWLGSMSDVSVASQATNTSTLSGIVRISQLICHQLTISSGYKSSLFVRIVSNDYADSNKRSFKLRNDFGNKSVRHCSRKYSEHDFAICVCPIKSAKWLFSPEICCANNVIYELKRFLLINTVGRGRKEISADLHEAKPWKPCRWLISVFAHRRVSRAG